MISGIEDRSPLDMPAGVVGKVALFQLARAGD